jgi:hypothetical protein
MKTKKQTQNSFLALIFGMFILFMGMSCNPKDQGSGEKDQPKAEKVRPPKTDIHTAALKGDLTSIEQHIAAGSDLDAKDPFGGSTPLITASVFGKTEVALALIKAGADLNKQNNDGASALHVAAFFGRKEIVEALLVHGADKKLLNSRGELAITAVQAPFEQMIPVYDFFLQQFGPMGLELDYDKLEEIRPLIYKMLL